MEPTHIILPGVLGKRYGRSHFAYLDTNTPAEAFRWLFSNFAGAKEFFATASERGIEFAIFRGKGKHAENLRYEQLGEPAGDTIRIAPVHSGAKNSGVLQTIVGVVLIVVGAMTSWTGVSAALITTGVGMVAGGVVQMLSPQPKLNSGADAADNQGSYIFNGPVNVTAQGVAVPVLYGGPMEIGSVVLSAGIEAVDYGSRPSNVDAGTADGNSASNPYQQ